MQRFLRNRLRKAREDAGLTMAKIAEIIDVRPLTVGNWDAGRSVPTAKYLSRYAHACGVDISFFFAKAPVGQPTGIAAGSKANA